MEEECEEETETLKNIDQTLLDVECLYSNPIEMIFWPFFSH